MDTLQLVFLSGLSSAFILAIFRTLFIRWLNTLLITVLLFAINAVLLWLLGVSGVSFIVSVFASCMVASLCGTLATALNRYTMK